MVYIYEILKNYYDGQPNLLYNWMFQEERMGMDKGKPFTLMGWDEQDRKEKPLMDLRRVGIIKNLSVDELLVELGKGRECGTAFLEGHGIEVPGEGGHHAPKQVYKITEKGIGIIEAIT